MFRGGFVFVCAEAPERLRLVAWVFDCFGWRCDVSREDGMEVGLDIVGRLICVGVDVQLFLRPFLLIVSLASGGE